MKPLYTCLAVASLVGPWTAGPAASQESIQSYFFNQSGTCTFLLDLQPRRNVLDRIAGDARAVELSKSLIDEFKSQGPAKCTGAATVRAIAVYIPGVDNYGRPAFGSRVNLLRLQAPADAFAAVKSGDFASVADIKAKFEVEIY